MLTPYPESFPSEAVSSLISMIRDKNADKEAMGLAAWNLQGYAQSKLLSNNPIRISGSSNPNPSDEDALNALNTLQLNADSFKAIDQDKSKESKSGVDNLQIMQANPMISIALSTVIKWLLNRVSSM